MIDETASPPSNRDIALRVLHTSDLHGALRGFDYLADRPSELMGLSRTATLIRAASAGAANTLLFDTGDALQGSPVCDLAAEHGLPPGQQHPMIAAMNGLGYDAFTPGNHDFNHGADFLFRALADARFAVVSANFLHAAPDGPGAPVFAPHAILTRRLTDRAGRSHDLRIAVIGCLPPQTVAWDHALAEAFATEDMVPAVRRALADVRRQGCDLTILLAHTGIDPEAPATCAENALAQLADLDGVDLVLGGHTHRIFPTPSGKATEDPDIDAATGRLHGTPALMSGFAGNHLGQVDLLLSPDNAGGWRVTNATCQVLPLARRDALGGVVAVTPEDPDFVAATAPAHLATLTYMHQPLGETLKPLHSFFSLAANDASVQLVARAQADHLRRALAGSPLLDLPLLSAAAPFKTGRLGGPEHYTHIPAGPLTRRSITDLYVYPNTICALKITGAALRDWLEHSASLFTRVTADTSPDAPLLDEDFPGYKFDVICGLSYDIDLAQPPRYDLHHSIVHPTARRIRNLAHAGRPVEDDDTFLIATNSYRVFGIGFADPAPELVYESHLSVRDILHDHLRHLPGPLAPEAVPVWSFTPLGGVRLGFETSPLARAYLGDALLPPLSDLGNTPDGFARFRITL